MNNFTHRKTMIILAAMAAIWFASANAFADTVVLGSDYLRTQPGTFINFGNGIGVVQLKTKPKPCRPCGTDTIVQRLDDAVVKPGGKGTPIPIKMGDLSLQSTSRVNVGGSFFDVFVTLDPSNLKNDLGQFNISENSTGKGGTYTSFFDVFYEADFTPVGKGPGFSLFGDLSLSNGGADWQNRPSIPDPTLVLGLVGDQNANLHTNLGPGQMDFFLSGTLAECGSNGCLVTGPASTPEPGTLLQLGTGFVSLSSMIRKRRSPKA
jgi:hypothetical protein